MGCFLFVTTKPPADNQRYSYSWMLHYQHTHGSLRHLDTTNQNGFIHLLIIAVAKSGPDTKQRDSFIPQLCNVLFIWRPTHHTLKKIKNNILYSFNINHLDYRHRRLQFLVLISPAIQLVPEKAIWPEDFPLLNPFMILRLVPCGTWHNLISSAPGKRGPA